MNRLGDNTPLKRGLVWVTPRRQKGILLEAVEESGVYRVLIEDEVIELSAQEILPVDAEHGESPIFITLALHHLDVRDAVDLLDKKIQRAILASADCIKVIHGDERGKVRKALHEYLGQSKRVRAFSDDTARRDTTWVYLN